jgi:hypothetical protein
MYLAILLNGKSMKMFSEMEGNCIAGSSRGGGLRGGDFGLNFSTPFLKFATRVIFHSMGKSR